jgi:sec-independent protein translocase protein TatA
MFGRIGPAEIILILLIVLLLFGARKLPEVGKSLGKGIREFKSGLKEGRSPEEGPPGKES